ncbi:MAG TPA: hypothetical protein VIL36_01445 [Acidimicrobiales bacterium]
MWKQLIGTAALLGALVGPLAPATQSSSRAQVPELTATLSPLYVNPGGQITVSAIQGCPQPMQVFWSLGPGGLSGSAPTAADGRWIVRFSAPARTGTVPFFAHCAFSQGANAAAMYKQLSFTVVAPHPPRYTG